MENGGDGEVLVRKMEALDLVDSSKDEFVQIMQAVEDAEASIKRQVEENNWLRSELEKKDQELRNYKCDGLHSQTYPSIEYSNNHVYAPQREMEPRNQINGTRTLGNSHAPQIANSIILKENVLRNDEYHVLEQFRRPAGGQTTSDLSVSPELLSPLISSLGEVNSRSLKQDLKLKIQEHEKEIILLREHLSEYAEKEAEVRREKHNLEKRIAHMHAAFDQQQRDLVDAASRSISYRQEIAEENIRLAYTLQAAEQQRSTFISSLMPLLAEYSLDSFVVDAQSFVGNVKVLFRHLRENLVHTEAKLKETQYHILPRNSDVATSNATQSPSDYTGAKDVLGLVQSPQYPDGNLAVSPNLHVNSDGVFVGNRQSAFGISPATILGQDQTGIIKQGSSRDFVSNSEFDDSDMEIHQNPSEPPASWEPKNSSYMAQEPSSSYSPNLPVVSEERSSTFSEDDDLLPTIEGLQISGDALPGRELQAYGHSTNGTTNCNFEWVRHQEDGSFNYIEGANLPQYLITADDVDCYLAIEVHPIDDRNRKGELVEVFANGQNKITCDPEMRNCISRAIDSGHASYSVSLSIGYLDMWEPAVLSVKKNGYSIKCSGISGGAVSEKYSSSTAVIIPVGSHMEFSIVDSPGDGHLLRADSTDISSCRDTIVLTVRYFIVQANRKKKSKKKSLFF